MVVEILLDVCELEHPKPLQKVLGVLDGLREGQYLRVVHRGELQSLCRLIDQLGFVHETRPSGDSTCDLFVWYATDKVTALAVQTAAQE